MKYEKKRRIFSVVLAAVCIVTLVGIFDFWGKGPVSFSPPPSTNLENGLTPETNKPEPTQSLGPSKPLEENAPTESGIPSTPPGTSQHLASSIRLDVPFTSQAPFAVWDNLHNEACEEAGLIMAKYWLNGPLRRSEGEASESLTPEKAEQEIQAAVKWQEENWGGHYDLPAEKIVELGQQFFNLKKTRILSNPTIEDIKKEVASGNLVLAPTAGRLLKNPYYRQPGPIYHMLVVRGYDEKWIITNDPGTRRGENFTFTYQNFFNSLHDWPYGPPDFGQNLSKDDKARAILSGLPVVIVVEK